MAMCKNGMILLLKCFNKHPPTKSTVLVFFYFCGLLDAFGIKTTVLGIGVSGRIQPDYIYFKHSIITLSLRFLGTGIYNGAGFISGKINAQLKKILHCHQDALQVLVLQKCVTVAF
jgi:hypothetical protein